VQPEEFGLDAVEVVDDLLALLLQTRMFFQNRCFVQLIAVLVVRRLLLEHVFVEEEFNEITDEAFVLVVGDPAPLVDD